MKGSDKIEMTINIGDEQIKIDTRFDEQDCVRDAEKDIKNFIDRIKKNWPDLSDKRILAMAAYQFANWYHKLLNIQEEANKIVSEKCRQIDALEVTNTSIEADDYKF